MYQLLDPAFINDSVLRIQRDFHFVSQDISRPFHSYQSRHMKFPGYGGEMPRHGPPFGNYGAGLGDNTCQPGCREAPAQVMVTPGCSSW